MAIAEQEVGILYTCQTGVYQVTRAAFITSSLCVHVNMCRRVYMIDCYALLQPPNTQMFVLSRPAILHDPLHLRHGVSASAHDIAYGSSCVLHYSPHGYCVLQIFSDPNHFPVLALMSVLSVFTGQRIEFPP